MTARSAGESPVLRVFVLLASIVAFSALAWWVLRTGAGQELDQAAMETVVAGRQTQLTVLSLLGYISISAIVAVALVCVALALAQGRVMPAVAALLVLAGANVTTQILKGSVLERVDGFIAAPNSFPSGHTTVVAAGVGALLLAAPRLLRPVVVLAGSFAIMITGASTVVAGWHRPSDVIGATLIALAWTAGAALLIRDPTRHTLASWFTAPVGAVTAGITLIAIGVRPAYGWSGFSEAALVLGLVAVAVAVTTALMEHVAPDRR